MRNCRDYRLTVNSALKTEVYPLPRIEGHQEKEDVCIRNGWSMRAQGEVGHVCMEGVYCVHRERENECARSGVWVRGMGERVSRV